jgi:DNA polymerase-1
MITKNSLKFIIIDGNSLIHRAFHALPLLATAKGEYTNGVFGFIKMLFKIIKEDEPDYLAVAFDIGKVTFRHDRFNDYKGTRKVTPDELKPQFQLVKDLLMAMNIPVFELEGYEADDLIGTLIKQGEKAAYENIIVTGDRDTLQLISDRTRVKLTRKGISEIEEFDLEALTQKYGLTPSQFIDLKGLMGDSSDNIPGVPGVGEKTGLKLLHQFGTLENILASIDQIQGEKIKERLFEFGEQALLSKELATISCNAPVTIAELVPFNTETWEIGKLLELFGRLEFKSLLGELPRKKQLPEAGSAETTYTITQLSDKTTFDKLQAEAEKAGELYLAIDRSGVSEKLPTMAGKLNGVALLAKETVFVWLKKDEGAFPIELAGVLADPKIKKVVHHSKEAYVILHNSGYQLQGITSDPMLMAYLLNPNNSGEDFQGLVLECFGKRLNSREDDLSGRLVEKALLTRDLANELSGKLGEYELDRLYQEVELPLANVLARMELEGIKVDQHELTSMGGGLTAAIAQLQDEIFSLAGEEFNINSPKQLGSILFDKLKLPAGKKTKTGYSTNAEVLELLADRHPIVAKLLDYRQLVKLKTTYIDGLLKVINPENSRVHTTFNQTVTATGRLSSTEPNLQNIPIRLEQGRQIRKAFVPQGEGRVLLAADYSQIELRVLAHISTDEKLINAFKEGKDIHTKTACQVFEVSPAEVTAEMRRRAKAVNFGIVYGISDFGLSRDLGIQRGEAKRYIENYLANYSGVKAYLEKVIAQARKTGYVTTILNRRRFLPDLQSRNKNIQSFGERTAMNTPIQGSAADIIKVAMLRVEDELSKAKLDCKMLLQVHDELIFDVASAELNQAVVLVKHTMEQAVPLAVPLQVDVKWGYNWYEMQEVN